MSRVAMRHMEDERLLRYADGELPAREARQVRVHLEACWQCRAELEELQKTVKECVRYRKNVLQEHLPPPPAPWTDIYRRFDELDAVPAGSALWGRMTRVLAFPARWVPAAVAAALVCGLVLYEWRETPTVEAAALLRKAVAASAERPAVPRRIRLRTSRQQASRVVGDASAATAKASADPNLAGIERMFQRANYSWDDPLSAQSFQRWREQLPASHDEVATIDDCYRIRTTTDSGEVKEATLKLSMDLRPLEGRLEFRDNEWVEISEMPEAPAEPAAPVAVASAHLPAAPGPVEPPVSTPPAATLGQELQVMAALHHMGADLGDPIEVTRAAGRIVVSGVGIAPERQRQIHGALDAMPHVVVRFSEPGEAVLPPSERATAEAAVSGEVLSLHARLAEQVGGRPHFEQLSAQLLDSSEAVMSRAYALRRLAQRFPPETERELGAVERRLLRDLGREHASALSTQAAGMERLLAPVLVSLGGRAGTASQAVRPAAWQLAAEDLFHAARHVEKLLAVMLGAAPGDLPAGELPSQLLEGMARVRAGSDACGRLAAEDTGAQGR